MNAPHSLHPDDRTLQSYGLGKLDEGSASTVHDHLEGCAECRQRVAGFTSDSFLGRFRDAQEPPGRSIPGVSLDAGTMSYMQARAAMPPPPADTLPPGLKDHPDYEIRRELGRGGMGVVYLAHNTMMGRDEVLKVMGRQFMDRPRVLERFQREIRAVAQLRHPNIVAAYTAFRIEGGLVFAMEYVEGLDLARLVKAKGPLSVSHAAYFIHQAALGLQHAHERGMIHRDIKPHNLMLTSEGKARLIKVLDFGLAKATREQKVDGELTSEGQALGTPDYIAPEQITNAVDVDIRADIYSLGGTLFYLLTGRPPFQGNTLYDIYQAHISRDAEPLNLLRPEVPAELAALVSKMMAKEPKRRFQTPSEVAEALQPFSRKAGAGSRNPGPDVSQLGPAIETRSMKAGNSPPQQVTDPGGPVVATKAEVAPTEAEPSWDSLISFRERERPEESESAFAGLSRRSSWRLRAAVVGVACLGLAIALGVIFRTRTSDGGTLVVEVNEPGAVVTVDNEPVTVTWDANRKRAEIKVRPGEREVQVTKDGFVAKGTKVTISEGDRVIMTAFLEPGAGTADRPKITEDLPTRIANDPTPEKEAGPTVPLIMVDRRAATFNSYPDDWKAEGGELVQTRKPGPSFPLLLFGDPNWTDYEFTFKVMMVEGSATYDSFGMVFRSRGPESRYMYAQAMTSNHCGLTASVFGKKDLELTKGGPTGICLNVWYSLRCKVRGGHIEGFISDGSNETALFDVEDDLHPNGRVGLMTLRARCRFKHLRVTTPDGKILWEGLPDGLPTNPPPVALNQEKGPGTTTVPPGLSPDGAPGPGREPPVPGPAIPGGLRASADKGPAAPPRPPVPQDKATSLTNSIGMRFAKIPAGSFLMGSMPEEYPRAHPDESPKHPVRISRPYLIGVTEVTQGQYRTVTGTNPSHFQGGEDLPVENVSWLAAVKFCKDLSAREELPAFFQIRDRAVSVPNPKGTGYRLPTEAEWEYACRAGSESNYNFGPDDAALPNFAWVVSNSGMRTHPVGGWRPNKLGLFDMHGNVQEWCWDVFDRYSPALATDPTGPPGVDMNRVYRNGAYDDSPYYNRSSYRGWLSPTVASKNIGFRVARSVPIVASVPSRTSVKAARGSRNP